jgi:hypothetical protein
LPLAQEQGLQVGHLHRHIKGQNGSTDNEIANDESQEEYADTKSGMMPADTKSEASQTPSLAQPDGGTREVETRDTSRDGQGSERERRGTGARGSEEGREQDSEDATASGSGSRPSRC